MYVQSAAAWKTSFNGGCDSSNIVDLSVSMDRNSKFICCIMDNLFHNIKKGNIYMEDDFCHIKLLLFYALKNIEMNALALQEDSDNFLGEFSSESSL